MKKSMGGPVSCATENRPNSSPPLRILVLVMLVCVEQPSTRLQVTRTIKRCAIILLVPMRSLMGLFAVLARGGCASLPLDIRWKRDESPACHRCIPSPRKDLSALHTSAGSGLAITQLPLAQAGGRVSPMCVIARPDPLGSRQHPLAHRECRPAADSRCRCSSRSLGPAALVRARAARPPLRAQSRSGCRRSRPA